MNSFPTKYSEFSRRLILKGILASASLFVGLNIAHELKKMLLQIKQQPLTYELRDINSDGRKDILFGEEFGNRVAIALPNGLYELCEPLNLGEYRSVRRNRGFTTYGIIMDRENRQLIDLRDNLETRPMPVRMGKH